MTFYRVENRHGSGPYMAGIAEKVGLPMSWAEPENNKGGRTPNPRVDEPPLSTHIPVGAKFGFYDLVQAYSWFTDDELIKLEEYGFSLKAVQGKPVAILEKQAIFVPA